MPWTKTFSILGPEGLGQSEGRYGSQARSDPLLLRLPVAMQFPQWIDSLAFTLPCCGVVSPAKVMRMGPEFQTQAETGWSWRGSSHPTAWPGPATPGKHTGFYLFIFYYLVFRDRFSQLVFNSPGLRQRKALPVQFRQGSAGTTRGVTMNTTDVGTTCG